MKYLSAFLICIFTFSSCKNHKKNESPTDSEEIDSWVFTPEIVHFPAELHENSPLYGKENIEYEDIWKYIWDRKSLNIYKIKDIKTDDIGFYVAIPTPGYGENIISIAMGKYYSNLKDLISDYYSNRRDNWTEAAFYTGDSGDIIKNREDFEVLPISKDELKEYVHEEIIDNGNYSKLKK